MKTWRAGILIPCLLTAIFAIESAAESQKSGAVVTKLADLKSTQVDLGKTIRPFATADECSVIHFGTLTWQIDDWVIGDEIYKAFQDPGQACDGPYPFAIQTVHFPIVFASAGTLTISADIETAIDKPGTSDLTCPFPGNALTITPNYDADIPGAGLYLISVPLDSDLVVTEPYFAGVYIANDVTPYGAAVVTDDISITCTSYNYWTDSIGFVDLNDNDIFNFPGRLALFSSGTPGGGGGPQPVPSAAFVSPQTDDLVGPMVDLWAYDAAGSEIIDTAYFDYFDGSDWVPIGIDTDPTQTLRNGVDMTSPGDGLSYMWDASGVIEGDHDLRVIVTDTLGRSDTAIVTVYVEPTPPDPTVEMPVFGGAYCESIDVSALVPDENVSYVLFEYKSANDNFVQGITPISQQIGGDVNGDPADGNPVANGEFGDYYSGPAVATMACRFWYDGGYPSIYFENGSYLTDEEVIDRIGALMNTEDDRGTFDGQFVNGLRNYIGTHGADFTLKINRRPTGRKLRSWIEDYEYVVMVGLSGDPGVWLTAAGATGIVNVSGEYTFAFADPITGAIADFAAKDQSGNLWVDFNGTWMEADLMVAMVPNDLQVTRQTAYVDFVPGDGWGFTWDISGFNEGDPLFLLTTAVDQDDHQRSRSILFRKSCTTAGTRGDLDDDGDIDVADIIYLVNMLYQGGPAPVAGPQVADANCDAFIDMTDIVYLMNYYYNGGPAPCM